MKKTLAKNPFSDRPDIEPSRLLITFLASDPGEAVREAVRKIKADPEELHIIGREVYVYFPNGMARPNLKPALLDKALQTPNTGRNLNSVRKLLEMAERLEGA